jgi:N-acyl-D-amino-acid deacylase
VFERVNGFEVCRFGATNPRKLFRGGYHSAYHNPVSFFETGVASGLWRRSEFLQNMNTFGRRQLFRNLQLILVVLLAATATGAEYDLVIRHGIIVDGTGNPAFHGDVAVQQGRIVAVGRIAGSGRREMDASGLTVVPGFIDVHTHADEVADMPGADNFVRMGVTTLVAGNCGSSSVNIGKVLRAVEKARPAVNFATLVGHNDVRSHVMGGNFDRPPTGAELTRMKGLVDQAMKDGAVGLSTGLIYQPGVFATTAEIVELARVAAGYDGIYTSHMRHEDTRILEAIGEVVQIAREAGIRAEISHIKLAGPSAWGRAPEVLAFIEKARAGGLDVTQDQYAYTASSTSLGQLIPDSVLEGGRKKYISRIADPVTRSNTIVQMRESLARKGRETFEYAVIASCSSHPELNGLNVREVALKLRGADTVNDQAAVVLDLQKEGGASAVFHGMNEEDLKIFLAHPNTMIACDSGLRKFGEGVPHPRGYGNNARILARYVRELKVLRLEDAIRRMTSLPAETYRFKDRGQLRSGFWADIVLFDAAKVQDTSTFKQPHAYPEGIPCVIVNGVAVLEGGKPTGVRSGQVLRHSPAL